MITSLSIQNFRCIKHLDIQNLGKIVVLSGKNNAGKTSILESIFSALEHDKTRLLFALNILRGNISRLTKEDIMWEHLFYNKNVDNELSIKLISNNDEVEYTMTRCRSIAKNGAVEARVVSSSANNESYKLHVKYKIIDSFYEGMARTVGDRIIIDWSGIPEITPHNIVGYVGREDLDRESTIKKFGSVQKAGKKQQFLNTLKLLDEDIEDIMTVYEDLPRIYIQKKDETVLPLATVGSGIYRLLEILCAMLDSENGVVLIDEIESGFHYSFYPKILETIEHFAKLMNVQVFMTSHSYEFIEAAAGSISDKEGLTYIRLGRENGNIVPHVFKPSILDYALRHGQEIR